MKIKRKNANKWLIAQAKCGAHKNEARLILKELARKDTEINVLNASISFLKAYCHDTS